jgi:tetratricopeptide (TPR) repeat protein
MLGDYARSAELVLSLREITPAPDAVTSYCHAVAGLLYSFLLVGRYELMANFLSRMEAAARTVEEPEPIALGWLAYGQLLQSWWLHGDPWGALEPARRSQAEFERAGDQRGAALARMTVGQCWLELGDFARAEQILAEVLAVTERLGLQPLTATVVKPLALAKAALGKLDEARVEMACALHLTGDSELMLAMARVASARLNVTCGDLAAAEREARAGAAVITDMTPPLRIQALATLAEVLLAAGRADEARRAAAEAFALLEALGGSLGEGEARARLVWAEALAAAGEAEAAQRAFADARHRLLERAARIDDATVRGLFLEKVEENARTLALAPK